MKLGIKKKKINYVQYNIIHCVVLYLNLFDEVYSRYKLYENVSWFWA